jgi:hypothetical protein
MALHSMLVHVTVEIAPGQSLLEAREVGVLPHFKGGEDIHHGPVLAIDLLRIFDGNRVGLD